MGKAAKRLAASQPSVSKAVSDIERELGVRLLDRTPQGVTATAHGRVLLRRGIGALDELRRGIKDIELLADPAAGEVRVGCPEAVSFGLLTEILSRFYPQHPRVVVSVYPVDNVWREFGLLRGRTVDFLLGAIRKPFTEEDLDAEVLYEDRPFIVSGAAHRLAHRRKIELAELVDEPWVLAGQNLVSSILSEVFQSKGLAFPKIGVRSYSAYARLKVLATDCFVSAESRSGLCFNMDRFSLKVLPVDFATESFQVGIVTLKNRTVRPVVKTFLDCVREVATQLADEQSIL